MCVPLVVNVDAHVEGFIGQTVSVILHETDCTDPETHANGEPHDHEH